jgi:hypothetical protein
LASIHAQIIIAQFISSAKYTLFDYENVLEEISTLSLQILNPKKDLSVILNSKKTEVQF